MRVTHTIPLLTFLLIARLRFRQPGGLICPPTTFPSGSEILAAPAVYQARHSQIRLLSACLNLLAYSHYARIVQFLHRLARPLQSHKVGIPRECRTLK